MQVCFINLAGILNAAFRSGVAPSIGLSTAFWGALVNGFFSGSNHSIYVPSAWTTGYAN